MKAISFRHSGQTYSTAPDADVKTRTLTASLVKGGVDINLSVQRPFATAFGYSFLVGFVVGLFMGGPPAGLLIGILFGLVVWGLFAQNRSFHLPFVGSSLQRLDEGRSGSGMAGGALAGALVLGPIGALAGAAMGGRKKHTLVLRYAQDLIVFEASTAELQTLAGKGLTAP